jgi:four helix bundle protein
LKNFKDLKVWDKAHKLALMVYEVTKDFPQEEIYGLISQMRRAAVSIPTNIAEGCGRNSDAELARFLEIAMGSASELQYLLLLSKELNFLNDKLYTALTSETTEIKQMLATLIKKVRAAC